MVYSDKDESEYGLEIKDILAKKSTEYDFILYNIHHTYSVGGNLINMKKLISLNTLEQYNKGVIKYVGYRDDSLVGIPLLANYGNMYYNKELLEKYNLPVPETWKQLNETLSYIYSKEKEINKDLIGYIGGLPENYVTINTIQEMIFSYRENKKSDEIPDYQSKSSIEAMTMLKYLLDNYSSKEYFQLEQTEVIQKILTGNVVFARMFNFPMSEEYKKIFNFIPIPGNNPGTYGSSIYGYNIGISKYVDEDKHHKMSIVLDYLFSEDMQKYLASSRNMYSPLVKLYSQNATTTNNNVCKKVDCELISNLQFFNKPINYYDSYDDFSNEFLNIIDNYLYKNKLTSEETLKHIDDLTLNHFVRIDSPSGLFISALFLIITFFIVVSYILMFHRKINVLFVFLNNNYWAVFLYGTFLILCYTVISVGEMTQVKCNLRFIALTLGLPISFSPLLLRLIVLFPESNRISNHISRNFSNYLCYHILFELLLCVLYLLFPFTVNNHLLYLSDGLENFQTCDCTNNLTKLILTVDIADKGIEILIFAILIFAEWNITATKTDIISLTFCISFDVIAFLIFAAFYFTEFKSKELYFWTKVGPALLFGLSNFFFVYVWKYISIFTTGVDDLESKEAYLQKKTNETNMRNITRLSLINSESKMTSTKSSISNNSENFFNKIIKCHYETANSAQDLNHSYGSNVNKNNVISTVPIKNRDC
ncbi:periplasmic binding protein-like II [Piromyces finnis]|uniref:Periplasmic binding protein-like II n=1 Tax=Piromyces finnis TaxID=1754191 RepID=A0A1Y1V8K5_9FUNG|nr:periplasmic binding protein-like II [Piromyces finnis]|eukprot:ORX49964.1 periplasmic binding protein-like II [Piromyces finnis]